MSKYTQTNVSTVSGVNSELAKIASAIDTQLDTTDNTANQMDVDLDMNSNDILNAGAVNASSIFLDGAEMVATGTFDLVIPTNSILSGKIVATSGQTVFTVPTFTVGANTIFIYVNGQYQYLTDSYTETDATTITFVTGLNAGDGFYYVVNQIAATTASVGGADLVDYTLNESGAVQRTVQAKLSETISVTDFGVYAGPTYSTTNLAAYVALVAYVNARGGYTNIYWPANPLDYEFSPKDSATYNATNDSWRAAIEMVDVKKVYHNGYGASIKLNADATWGRGHSDTGAGAVSIGCDESPIQFRATVADACEYVGVLGLKIYTDATVADQTTGTTDGNTYGIAYKGCNFTKTEDVECNYWGTDGIYVGSGYTNSPQGRGHYIKSPSLSNNYRQGISIVGCDDGIIDGGEIKDTSGGSFGYAIDLETDSTVLQSNWTITGLKTSGNQRGGINHIRTQNVSWINCTFDEQSTDVLNAGCIRMDGGSGASTTVKNIRFENCRIIGKAATLYFDGNYIDRVSLNNCHLTCTNDVNSSSQLRINASTEADYGLTTITNCLIDGNGGLEIRGATGGLDTKLIFTDNEWYPSNESAATVDWIFSTHSDFVEAIVSRNTIDHTKNTFTKTATYEPNHVLGTFDGNVLESTSTFAINWKDYTAGRGVKIGVNTWGTYSFYLGCATGLDLKTKTAGVQSNAVAAGDFSVGYRVVHGGLKRITEYTSSAVPFIDEQLPVNGDITYSLANNTGSNKPQTSYIYDGTSWVLGSFITYKDVTGSRPAATAVDIGLQYLDTTLDADGKLITWNGVAWVDGVGATV